MKITVGQDILILTLAVYLGLITTDFFRTLTTDLILPILAPILPTKDELGKINFKVWGNGFVNLANVISEMIHLVIAVIITILFAKSIRLFGRGVLTHFYV